MISFAAPLNLNEFSMVLALQECYNYYYYKREHHNQKGEVVYVPCLFIFPTFLCESSPSLSLPFKVHIPDQCPCPVCDLHTPLYFVWLPESIVGRTHTHTHTHTHIYIYIYIYIYVRPTIDSGNQTK